MLILYKQVKFDYYKTLHTYFYLYFSVKLSKIKSINMLVSCKLC